MANLCSYSLIIERGDAETETFAKVKSFLDSNTKTILDPLYKGKRLLLTPFEYTLQDYHLNTREDRILIFGNSRWQSPQAEMYVLLEALSKHMACDLTQIDAYMTWTEFSACGCGHIDFFFHEDHEISSIETCFDTPQDIHELLKIIGECPPLKDDVEWLIEDLTEEEEEYAY